ncbi:MAG: transcriptional repressor [Mariprofundaceae bacterium]
MKKLTIQRQAILDLISHSNRHWGADELALSLSESGQAVGIATIYRGLAALEQAGFIHSIQLGDKKHYERADKDHHDHLICTDCGRIEEFFDKDIEYRQQQVAEQQGFSMSGHQLLIFGRCRTCLQQVTEQGIK